ncbi:MAG: 6-bladed beta-propeller, partial [Candidatus Aegiribacteria sp.]|nr:6-bladed beta-propeller [Candidatus Aegiribacteria sp.]
KWREIRLFIVNYCIILLITLITGCGRDQELPDDQITLPVDTLQVTLEIGEEIGDSTNIFGSIIAAGIDEQGRIIVLDEIEACLKVFDMQGNYIQQVSRRGAGPGELMYPKGFFIMPDGRIGINSSDKSGYIIFDDSLKFVEEISLWQDNSPYHVTPISNSRLVTCRFEENIWNETNFLRHTIAIYGWREEEWDTFLWKDSIEITENDFIKNPSAIINYIMFDRISTCSNEDGNIYFAPKDSYEYRITGWDSTGTEILTITRDMTAVMKTPEEITDEIFYATSYLQRSSGRPLPFEFHPAPYRNMIIDVGIGPSGNLWVRRGTRNEPFFDIYDLDGNLLHHAVFPDDGLSWETEVTSHGILAWEADPLEGYQKLYLIE